MSARATMGALGAAAVLAHASTAASQGAPPVRLAWAAPAGCPTGAEVLASAQRILGDSSSAGRHAVVARAVVSHGPLDRWRVELTTRVDDLEGVRSFGATSCAALADATALVLALAVNPETVPPPPPVVAVAPAAAQPAVAPPPTAPVATPSPTSATPPATSGPGPAAPTAAATPATPPRTAATPPRPPPPPKKAAPAARPPTSGPPVSDLAPHRVMASLSAAGGVGTLPSLAFGGDLDVAVRVWRVRLEIDGTYWGGQTAALTGGVAGERASFTSFSFGLRAGYPFALGRFEVIPFLTTQTSRMTADPTSGVTDSTGGGAFWFGLGGGGEAFFRLTRELAVRLAAHATAPVGRPRFEVTLGKTTQGTFTPGPVAGEGTIGLELRFL